MLTDYLDGYFARRRNQVTRLGILLDPIADKLLTAAAFLSLVEMDAVPAWMVMIILGRELAVTGLRNVAAGWGHLIPASGLGKGKMVAQVVAIFLLLIGAAPAPGLPARAGPGHVVAGGRPGHRLRGRLLLELLPRGVPDGAAAGAAAASRRRPWPAPRRPLK